MAECANQRSPWVGTDRDCVTPTVKEVYYDLCITVWNGELSGDAWNDIRSDYRGFFKRRLVLALLRICRNEYLGTREFPFVPSFMYQGRIPKVEAAYEVLRTDAGTKCGYRLHFIVHDPGFLFGNGVLDLIKCNSEQNAKEKSKKRYKSAQPEDAKPHEEWKELDSIGLWAKWLKGAYIEESKDLDIYTVCDKTKHLTSLANPANPHVILSLQRDLDQTRIPNEIPEASRPRKEQTNIRAYKLGDEKPVDALGAFGMDLSIPGYCDGDGGEGGNMFQSKIGSGQQSISEMLNGLKAPRGRKGSIADVIPPKPAVLFQQESWTLTFPYPEDVFFLNSGEDMAPYYVFNRLRPDISKERKMGAVDCAKFDPVLLAQTGDLAAGGNAADTATVKKLVEELRRDCCVNAGKSVEKNKEGDLYEQLSKADKLLRMRRRNLEELERLKNVTANLPKEERAAKMREWKVKKLREFMDDFKNGDAADMNEVMVSIRNYFNGVIAEKKTLASSRYCKDPSLSMFANMMMLFRSAADKLFKLYTAHGALELAVICLWSAYKFGLEMSVNLLFPGNKETSKTFLILLLELELFISGTVSSYSRATAKAFQTGRDENGKLFVQDEMSLAYLGMDESGKAIPCDPVWKAMLTSGYIKVESNMGKTDGGRTTETIITPCKVAMLMSTNNKVTELEDAWRSRFLVYPMSEDRRHEDDFSRDAVFYGLWQIDEDLKKDVQDMIRTLQMGVYLVECLIKVAIFEDVDTSIAKHVAGVVREELSTNNGIETSTRDSSRMVLNMRTVSIMTAVYTLFVSELGTKYKMEQWDDTFLLDLEPLLVVQEEQAYYIAGIHSEILVPKHTQRILQTAVKISRNTLPVEDANGVLTNVNDVEFRNGHTDNGKENPYDHVLIRGTKQTLVTNIRMNIGYPKPPEAIVEDVLTSLSKKMVSVRNRNTDGSVITKAGLAKAPQKVIGRSADYEPPVDKNANGNQAQPQPQPQQQQQSQGQLVSPGTHMVKAIIFGSPKNDGQTHEKVAFIATDILLKNAAEQSMATTIIKKCQYCGTRPRKVLTGVCYEEQQADRTLEPRKYPYLINAINLERIPDKEIIVRKLFTKSDVVNLLYNDMRTVNEDVLESSKTEVVQIKSDWETYLYKNRIAKWAPTPEMGKAMEVYIPAVTEVVIKKLHESPRFKEVAAGKLVAVDYPVSVAAEIKAKEARFKKIKNKENLAADSVFVHVIDDKNAKADTATWDVTQFDPALYMCAARKATQQRQQQEQERQQQLPANSGGRADVYSSGDEAVYVTSSQQRKGGVSNAWKSNAEWLSKGVGNFNVSLPPTTTTTTTTAGGKLFMTAFDTPSRFADGDGEEDEGENLDDEEDDDEEEEEEEEHVDEDEDDFVPVTSKRVKMATPKSTPIVDVDFSDLANVFAVPDLNKPVIKIPSAPILPRPKS